MANLISTWSPNKEYNKLDLVRFMSSSYLLSDKVEVGTAPINYRMISNGIKYYSNINFIKRLNELHEDSIKIDTDNSWKILK